MPLLCELRVLPCKARVSRTVSATRSRPERGRAGDTHSNASCAESKDDISSSGCCAQAASVLCCFPAEASKRAEFTESGRLHGADSAALSCESKISPKELATSSLTSTLGERRGWCARLGSATAGQSAMPSGLSVCRGALLEAGRRAEPPFFKFGNGGNAPTLLDTPMGEGECELGISREDTRAERCDSRESSKPRMPLPGLVPAVLRALEEEDRLCRRADVRSSGGTEHGSTIARACASVDATELYLGGGASSEASVLERCGSSNIDDDASSAGLPRDRGSLRACCISVSGEYLLDPLGGLGTTCMYDMLFDGLTAWTTCAAWVTAGPL